MTTTPNTAAAPAHTPGPWEADADDMAQGADDIFSVAIWGPGPDGERPLIASVSAFSLNSTMSGETEVVTPDCPAQAALDEAKANVRLIAAAPNMVARLVAVEKLLAAIECTDYPVSEELALVRADIALALGSAA